MRRHRLVLGGSGGGTGPGPVPASPSRHGQATSESMRPCVEGGWDGDRMGTPAQDPDRQYRNALRNCSKWIALTNVDVSVVIEVARRHVPRLI